MPSSFFSGSIGSFRKKRNPVVAVGIDRTFRPWVP